MKYEELQIFRSAMELAKYVETIVKHLIKLYYLIRSKRMFIYLFQLAI
jgi:hypothetical protein